MSKSLGPEMSRGQSLFAAGIVLELYLVLTDTHIITTILIQSGLHTITGLEIMIVTRPTMCAHKEIMLDFPVLTVELFSGVSLFYPMSKSKN